MASSSDPLPRQRTAVSEELIIGKTRPQVKRNNVREDKGGLKKVGKRQLAISLVPVQSGPRETNLKNRSIWSNSRIAQWEQLRET